MRTKMEILEYVDRMIDVGVDKAELGSQFAVIELQSVSVKQDENCDKMLAPLVENADERKGTDGRGI